MEDFLIGKVFLLPWDGLPDGWHILERAVSEQTLCGLEAAGISTLHAPPLQAICSTCLKASSTTGEGE